MASITLTGIQANTSLHQDQENVALLQRLREVMQQHQDPEKGFQHLRAIFLQRATSFLTVFVDESQQRTLTDVLFMCMLYFLGRARVKPEHITQTAEESLAEMRQLFNEELRPERHMKPRRPSLTQIEHWMTRLCVFLMWYRDMPFGKPLPWSFDYLTDVERNAYVMDEQARGMGSQETQEDKDATADDDSDWEEEAETKRAAADEDDEDNNAWLPLWSVVMPLQSMWLAARKRQEVVEQHTFGPRWRMGHDALMPSLWDWVNVHAGHFRVAEARRIFFLRLLPGGRREQMLRFAARGYEGSSSQNILRMSMPLPVYEEAVKRVKTKLLDVFLPPKGGAGDDGNEDDDDDDEDQDEDAGRALERRRQRARRLTPAAEWTDLHIAWYLTQLDSYLRDDPGISFTENFLLQDYQLLEQPYFWTGKMGDANRVMLRAPIVVELFDRRTWGVSVAHKRVQTLPNGRRVYQERLDHLELFECDNVLDAVQCWVNCLAQEPYCFRVVDADGVERDLSRALQPLQAVHQMDVALEQAMAPAGLGLVS